MTYFKRSEWTSNKKTAPVIKGTGRVITEIYGHYIGSPSPVGIESDSSTKNRLRGYWNLHVKINGWKDIAYNLAVDQKGNIWELRGIDRQSGANGGTVTNRRGQAILCILGNTETPTPAMINAFKEAVKMIRAEHPKAKTIKGHRESFEASTQCPGDKIMALIKNGSLEPDNKTSVSKPLPTPVKPKPVSKPVSAPTFPLPKGFYYGPKEGGVQSVSGRTYNSKVPHDVVKDKNGNYYSKGLKQAQQKLKDRGWTISVDGRFGPQTEKVVSQFNKNKRGRADSKLGPETWKLIFTLPVT